MLKHRLAILALAVTLGELAGCGGGEAKRMPASGFMVAFESHDVITEMKTGERVFVNVTLKNISSLTWPSKPDSNGLYAVNLGYHWLTRKGEMVVLDGERTPLPRDLDRGDSVTLKAMILPPEKPGAYILEITLVQEAVAWFPERGGAKLSIPVNVVERRAMRIETPLTTFGEAKDVVRANNQLRPDAGKHANTHRA